MNTNNSHTQHLYTYSLHTHAKRAHCTRKERVFVVMVSEVMKTTNPPLDRDTAAHEKLSRPPCTFQVVWKSITFLTSPTNATCVLVCVCVCVFACLCKNMFAISVWARVCGACVCLHVCVKICLQFLYDAGVSYSGVISCSCMHMYACLCAWVLVFLWL